MNLPFTPTFFKKLDIYQQLIEFEKEINIKPIWKAEKIILEWAAGSGHQHIGSYINTAHLEKPLEDEVKEDGRLGADAVSFAIHRQKVLDALVVRGFAEKHPQNESIRFNQMGLFAGKILKETNHLKTPFKYRAWTVIWWIILIFATIIVLGQTVTAVKIIIKSFSI